MPRSITVAAAAAFVGALAGGVCLVFGFTRHPGLTLEMDRELPRIASGYYGVELNGEETFAWTRRRAAVTLPGLDRRAAWVCSVRFRGGRPGQIPQPVVELAIDGVTLATRTATNEYQDLEVTTPVLPARAGLAIALTSSPPFIPGPSDPRELGVQVDRIACRPAGPRMVLPPRRAMAAATIGAAAFGAALGLTGVPLVVALAATLLLAIAQSVPLLAGPAQYSIAYRDRVVWIAIWTASSMVLGARILESVRRQPLSRTAKVVIAFSAGALYLQLLALLHPSKAVVDAVFQAHRLEWVLSGRYYFTQLMPDGVRFPYAIALFVFAAPWAAFTRDHVALLRVIVAASQIVAGALLYPMIVRAWGDRVAGAVAVALFSLVPLPYVIVGNANLTNAFGQSAALATVASATLWSLQRRDVGQLAGLALLAALGFLSHVSTFSLLAATLLAIALCYGWRGGPALRVPARSIVIATIMAAVVSVMIYYGWFPEVYERLGRIGGAGAGAAVTVTAVPLQSRVTPALALTARAFGWPILVLALVGVWRVWRRRESDRLRFALAAWGLMYVAFVLSAVLAPMDEKYLRYAAEFIDRVNFAALPAACILAAYGAAWAWRAGVVLRTSSAALLGWAAIGGVQAWLNWLR